MSASRPRLVPRELGPATISVLVVGQGVLWSVARPAGESTASYVGQLLGAESILLLSIGLVLISMLPWVEEWFDGIDRAAIWHRRVAIAGLFLLAPHILLASSRNGTALGAPLGAIGAIGLVALALWAILPRWQSVVPAPLRSLVVAARDAPGVRDVRRIFGGYDRWRALHRTTGLFVAAGFAHGVLDGTPFTISSAPREDVVRVTVKALGDYTSRLRDLIEPGMPAVIGGPHGRFDHARGTDRQVWIAAGVGVAPFLSWLRALDEHPPRRVDFFYSAAGEGPFAQEIRQIADRHPSLRAHLIDTSVDGRLTPERILATTGGEPRALSVFMCGPNAMLSSFQAGFRQAGVPARRIHREHFDWR